MLNVKVLGKVDLNTGIIYDNNGNIMPKEQQGLSIKDTPEQINTRRSRARAWFEGANVY